MCTSTSLVVDTSQADIYINRLHNALAGARSYFSTSQMIDSVTKSQSVGKNAVWNLATYIFSVTVTFFVSPFTIRTLGDSRYGAWALMAKSEFGILRTP